MKTKVTPNPQEPKKLHRVAALATGIAISTLFVPILRGQGSIVDKSQRSEPTPVREAVDIVLTIGGIAAACAGSSKGSKAGNRIEDAGILRP